LIKLESCDIFLLKKLLTVLAACIEYVRSFPSMFHSFLAIDSSLVDLSIMHGEK